MYNPYDNLKEYDVLVDSMANDIIQLLNKQPTQVGHSAILLVLLSTYIENGHSLKVLLTEVANAYHHYEKQAKK